MHTLSIECSDQAYEHIMYFLETLPQGDVSVIDIQEELNHYQQSGGFKQVKQEFADTLLDYQKNGSENFLTQDNYNAQMKDFKQTLKKNIQTIKSQTVVIPGITKYKQDL